MSTVTYRFIAVGPCAGAYAAVIDLVDSREIKAYMFEPKHYAGVRVAFLRCVIDDDTDEAELEKLVLLLSQQSVDRLIVEVQLCIPDSDVFSTIKDRADTVLIDGFAALSNLSDDAVRRIFKSQNTEPIFRAWMGSRQVVRIHEITGLLPYVFIPEDDCDEEWGVAKMFARDAKVGIPIIVQRDIWNTNLEPAELERMTDYGKET